MTIDSLLAFQGTQPHHRRTTHNQMLVQAFSESTPYLNCLEPLLNALNWTGSAHQLAQALPHFAERLDMTGFCKIMEELHFQRRKLPVTLKDLDPRLAPCLFITKNEAPLVILKINQKHITVFNGQSCETEELDNLSLTGTVWIFKPKEIQTQEPTDLISKRSWLFGCLKEHKALIAQGFLLSLALSGLALAAPLYLMAIFDHVLKQSSQSLLTHFSIGFGIAIASMALLQTLRARLLNFIGTKLNLRLGNLVMEKLLGLPPKLTESANVGAQVSRIKDFDTLRTAFNGSKVSLLFELPFTVIFLAAIASISGTLAWIPVVATTILCVAGYLLQPIIRHQVKRAVKNTAQKQEFLLEALSNMHTVKHTASEGIWSKRFTHLNGAASIANFQASTLNALIDTAAEGCLLFANLFVLILGVRQVMVGAITPGAMLATFMLTTAFLAPIKSAFSFIIRSHQLHTSLEELDRLIGLPSEKNLSSKRAVVPKMEGQVRCDHVSMHYHPDMGPALTDITFEVQPGELVAIVGRNGSGKSTLLKLIHGMYQPSSGSIFLDEQDSRQYQPIELRRAIAYTPQQTQLFYGTIAQNLRLANPIATFDDLREATQLAGIYEDIMALTEGFETRIRNQNQNLWPSSFQKRLCLARAFLKRSKLFLLDEPISTLDAVGDRAFISAIESFRNRVTVFMVTHRPSHLQVADRILLLNEGRLYLNGKPRDVLHKIPKDLL